MHTSPIQSMQDPTLGSGGNAAALVDSKGKHKLAHKEARTALLGTVTAFGNWPPGFAL